jgi:hypothetical protein
MYTINHRGHAVWYVWANLLVFSRSAILISVAYNYYS